ncbi:MAG: ribosome silencing factor [Gammaproteobacteria bacterium]|nr:ribosome silencing factor [Gammaproteobacteria bacterium]
MASSASGVIPQESIRMRDTIVNALEDAKGMDVRVLDVREMTDVTDYMIVATGTSDRHVKSLADRVLEFMHAQGWRHLGVEGLEVKDWILVDFVDVVAHVMRDSARKKYDLESLWDKTFAEVANSDHQPSVRAPQ